MVIGLISFMTDSQTTKESEGLGGIISSPETRSIIAKQSIEIIKNHPVYKSYFSEFAEKLFK